MACDRDAYELSLDWDLMEKLYEHIGKQYRPNKIDCRGIVVVARDGAETRARRSLGRDLGWQKFFNIGLQIVVVETQHLTLPREYSRELELSLIAALDRSS